MYFDKATGKPTNTAEDNAFIEAWLQKQPKIGIKTEDGTVTPLPYVTAQSDLNWCRMTLKSRMEHPERYEADENVPEVIESIKRQIAELEAEQIHNSTIELQPKEISTKDYKFIEIE